MVIVSDTTTDKLKHIKFAKTRPDAIIPSRNNGNAGFDIYGVLPNDDKKGYILINPHETVLIPTGIKSIISDGYYIQIEERGSTGSKGIKYSAGVIGSSYRGEWFLVVTNTNNKPVVFHNNSCSESHLSEIYAGSILYPLSKAIFQGVIHSTHDEITIEEVPLNIIENDITERREGKLGSSGK